MIENNLRKEIMSTPNMVKFIINDIKERALSLYSKEELSGFKRIVMSGCGDSLAAAYATKEAFEKLTDKEIDTPVCIDLSRHYTTSKLGADTLVIVISFSGKVSRVVEAANRARKNGAATLAVTHYDDSPVALACDKVLTVVPDPFDLHRTPGCRTYAASMTALYSFAISVGTITGVTNKDKADDIYNEMLNSCDTYNEAIPALDDILHKKAVLWRDTPYFEFLSAGPEFASAWFGQAKIFEATGDFARYENFEDWAHVDYILRKTDSLVFLFCTKENQSLSRAKEVASVLTRQDYRYIVFTDCDKNDFADPLKVVNIPSSKYLFLNPLMQTVLPCLFASALQHVKGTTEFCADMIDTIFPFGGGILRNSEIEEH